MNARPGAAHPATRLIVLTYNQDLLAYAAADIIANARSPELADWIVLLPDLLLQAGRNHGLPALLGPTITTLDNWLNEQPQSGRHKQVNHQTTRLMLVEALREHPQLYGSGGPWALADSLIVLFDELTRQCVRLPDSLEDFTRQLHLAYRSNGAEQPDIPLTREAHLVYSMWHAWQEQQRAEGLIDPEGARIQRLRQSMEKLPAGRQLVLIGHDHLSTAERDWLRHLMKQDQARLLLHGAEPAADEPDPAIDLPHFANACRRLYQQLAVPMTVVESDTGATGYDDFIDTVFAPLIDSPVTVPVDQSDLAGRSKAFAKRYPSSCIIKSSIFF